MYFAHKFESRTHLSEYVLKIIFNFLLLIFNNWIHIWWGEKKKHIMKAIVWKPAYLSYCSEIVAAVIAVWTVTPPGHVDGAKVDGVHHDADNGEDGTNYVHEHSKSNLSKERGGGDVWEDGVGGVPF